MEYYYRCSKCGRRTPSFEYEDYLNQYAIDWKISENEKLCDKCVDGKINNPFNKWAIVIMFLILLIFGFLYYL